MKCPPENRSFELEASVVVPTHGRPDLLSRLLTSLAEQNLPESSYEVIVVDDGSTVPIDRERMPKAGNQHVYTQIQQGPAAARNYGATKARGGLILFIDDDCLAAPSWLEKMLAVYDPERPTLLGGTTVNGLPSNLFSAAAESLLAFFDEYQHRQNHPIDFMASNNIACDLASFKLIGGFNACYPLAAGEDREFCLRWQQAGLPLKRIPDAEVKHFHALNLQRFWRQQYNYGRGSAIFHSSVTSAAPTIKPLRFYVSLVVHPLTRRSWPWWQRVATLPLIILSQLAVIAGRVRESFLPKQ